MNERGNHRLFLNFSIDKLQQLASRIDTCVSQLSDLQVWARGSENENAVGNLVLHLCGNVRQWIIASIGGEPDDRERDREFSARAGADKAELRQRLGSTVRQAMAVIDGVIFITKMLTRSDLGFYRDLSSAAHETQVP